ncbi:MAG: DUF1552 domain-containing protein [Myxococcota bacterium]
MKNIGKKGRRQFLLGAGGFTLALPVLPSLLSKEARAQVGQQKRFVAMATTHGGVPAANMFPGDGAAPETLELFPGHVAHHGALDRSVDGSDASLSPVLTAPASLLTDRLASKINVVRGLGIMQYMGHHSGGHLGNYGATDQGDGAQRATIDQVMAWSDSFYVSLAGVVQRTIHVDSRGGAGKGMAYGHSNPTARSGRLEGVPGEENSLALFDRLFGDITPSEPAMPRQPVVDRVLEHYRGMTSGRFGDAQRLSAEDRTRLTDHMERMAELQRRLETSAMVSCGELQRPAEGAGFRNDTVRLTRNPVNETVNASWYQLFNDVIATAIMCNVTSLATIYPRDPFVDGWNGNDWHERVAHAGDGATLGRHVTSVFRHIFLDLATKLDVEEANGRTYLDNSLIQFSQESGFKTHFSLETPLVTAGSAGGFFRTGRFVDYRYRESTVLPKRHWTDERGNFREGLTWNQYLGNVLRAMGLRPDEYEVNGDRGYGDLSVDPSHATAFHSGIRDAVGDDLPLLVTE